jgi:hypothetical protein
MLRGEVEGLDSLKVGEALNKGKNMLSPNKRYLLRVQEDRNVVHYNTHHRNRIVWSWNCSQPDRDTFKLIVTENGELQL